VIQKTALIISLLFGIEIHNSYAQRGELLYESIPRYSPDTLLIYNEFCYHAFFGFEVCNEFTSLKYGFINRYRGCPNIIRKASYKLANYRTDRILKNKYGEEWRKLYTKDLLRCRKESVFENYLGELPDSTFRRINKTANRARITTVSPMQFLTYLSTGSRYYSNKVDSEGHSIRYEVRRNVNVPISKKDNWVTKTDITDLIKYIYSKSEACRACQCQDTAKIGNPSTLGMEAFKLISIYRGYDYPTSFETVTPAQATELFDWWLEERKRK
jgi:hypothetical protein